MFAVARVPLEFTAGSSNGRLLPPAMCTTPFVVGALLTFLFGLARLSPLLVGAAEGWRVRMPLWEALHEFDWSYVTTSDGRVFPLAIGFAFLVPSDVSFSVWFFYLFVYGQAVVAYGLGRPLEGGRSGAFTLWQQAGAFITLAVGLFWMARRHLWTVVRKAFGRARDTDDSGEPIGFRLGFWGLLLSVAGLIGWNLWFGMGFWAALALVALTFSLVLVHSRVVAQGGLFFTQQFWNPPMILHGLSGGRIFSGRSFRAASSPSMPVSCWVRTSRTRCAYPRYSGGVGACWCRPCWSPCLWRCPRPAMRA